MQPATHFLYSAATGSQVHPGPEICCLCGLPCDETVAVGDVIRDTFTNHGLCRAPYSQVVCLACAFYFNHRWAVGKKYEHEFRKCSLHVEEDGWKVWPRGLMRADLEAYLRGKCSRCVLVIGLSKKKHCLPLAQVNPPGNSFIVQLEEEQVQLCPAAWFPLAAAFDELLSLGAHKGEILSGDYHHQTLRKAGMPRVLALDRRISAWRPGGLLTLLSYVTVPEDDDGETGGETGD